MTTKRFGKFVPLKIELLRRAKKRFGKFIRVQKGTKIGSKSKVENT